jgi:hypothetical protein
MTSNLLPPAMQLLVYPDETTEVATDKGGNETPLRYIDPITKQVFLIDSRTGNSWRPPVTENIKVGEDSISALKGRQGIVDTSFLRKRNRADDNEDEDKDSGIRVDQRSLRASNELPEWMMNTLSAS